MTAPAGARDKESSHLLDAQEVSQRGGSTKKKNQEQDERMKSGVDEREFGGSGGRHM